MNLGEIVALLLPLVKDAVTASATIGIGIALLARLLPNDKVYAFGFRLGKKTTQYFTFRFGRAWNKIEDFIINSVGKLLDGFRDGLQSDDDPTIKEPTVDNSIDRNVRI